MSIRISAIGFSVMAALGGAYAQDAAQPARLAAVDALGRVLPVEQPPASFERIDSTFAAVAPCAGVKAIAADEARALVVRIATEENFYPDFVQAVAKNESRFNSIALSDKGAFGLMQLKPETAQRFKVDLCNPADNVRGGVRFLRALHEKYRNPFFILAAYNAGEGAVEENRGVPPFPETVRFVAQVINDFYVWPAPGNASRPGRRTAVGQPDLIEPDTPSAAAASPTKAAPEAHWSDGFVMHVD
ncbi:lytic transglycosylase, catalytic [Afipia carboxidovorans OM5]|uniref:Putative lytic transglycosylase n=1 Tax=Afipia carboxidovorans (strain ATCC 49405 / DSM 1227 / KCTC 32145 / OM5) TaxID=504832 RepID=B6JK40_AFIC5|nr:lytic transglycosylase domain-containing protein [Afipia carboxidovorans]ACI94790.1 lytic transglycosylase, catalytic [Afipia carboxidovorans OM5]AEI04689.1 putative lytic transglycosylase [Afipia carboxidovorans OM4]AEI08318.1 putative lytic transglycosylase [Afipia carboxidovorans OM5]